MEWLGVTTLRIRTQILPPPFPERKRIHECVMTPRILAADEIGLLRSQARLSGGFARDIVRTQPRRQGVPRSGAAKNLF